MNDLRKAAEMALEALDAYSWEQVDAATKALRKALAQPVDAVNTLQERVDETAKGEHESFGYLRREPFGYFRYDLRLAAWVQNQGGIPFYTAPPKREWVGLTADEIWKCNKAETGSAVEFHICVAHQNVLDFAEAIEAKLKEKNGG